MRQTRLRSVSPKRAAEQRARRTMLERHHGPVRCHFPGGCPREAVDPHEILTRGRGGSITDPDNVLPLCREHHDWIGDYPSEALAMGLLASGFTVSDTAATLGSVSDTPNHTPRVSFRMKKSGIDWLDRLAAEHAAGQRSDVIRACFEVAAIHERDVVRRLAVPRKEPTP